MSIQTCPPGPPWRASRPDVDTSAEISRAREPCRPGEACIGGCASVVEHSACIRYPSGWTRGCRFGCSSERSGARPLPVWGILGDPGTGCDDGTETAAAAGVWVVGRRKSNP